MAGPPRPQQRHVQLPTVFTFTFTFTAPAMLAQRLSFSPSPPSSARGNPRPKRLRPLNDVDGDGSGECRKKKRRLRLVLITSRLSRPFAAPSTHIVDRGSSKIAIWAKQRALGRNPLRKAAIMNQMELARQAFLRRQLSAPQIPQRQHLPLPPSPLGLSNYDALDAEDGFTDDHHGEDMAEGCAISSDFNILEPAEPVVDDYDSLDDFAALPPKYRPPSPPSEKELDAIREKERQREVLFVQFDGISGFR